MGSYSRDNNRSGGRPTMHKATCNDCGNSCEIPFRPTGGRPVYCSNCFEKQGGGGRSDKFGGDRHSRPRYEDKQMHHAVCDKCNKDCQVPFRPTSNKPIYCDNCFGKGGNTSTRTNSFSSGSSGSGELSSQIKALNVKMDKLMEIFIPKTSVKKTEKKEIKVKKDVKETVKKTTVKKKVAKKVVKKKKATPKKVTKKKKK